ALCFYIAKILGRDAVTHLVSQASLNSIDKFFERYGVHSILIARLLPFISFDLVSYAAGLTAMKFWPFFIATGLGQLPATIVYSYLGGMLTGGAQMLMTGLLILFALTALVALLRKMYKNKHEPASQSYE
ncbi:MAG: TVP38/TMEM64 family protein, partial [Synergistaceae bacterium]|nr:TVP38/TMEM64 family protein [Synergistaceae bacterium]